MGIPNTKSAEKRLRQSERRWARNRRRKLALRRVIKQIKEYLAAGEQEKAKELIPQLMKAADKAASHRAIHPNQAARIKSRWMRKVSQS